MASKLNIVVRLQHWMDSIPGQTFLNYAYSWGASIVILGALFKLTHLPGGNLMLFLGMGTEAFVFFLAAFDRPFDKNASNTELAADFETDEEIERAEAAKVSGAYAGPVVVGGAPVVGGAVVGGAPVVGGTVVGGAPIVGDAPVAGAAEEGEVAENDGETIVVSGGAPAVVGGVVGGTTVVGVGAPVVGGGAPVVIGSTPAVETPATEGEAPAVEAPAAEGEAPAVEAPAAGTTFEDPLRTAVSQMYNTPEGEATVEQEASKLAEIIRMANDELLRRAQAVLSPEMEAATEDYIEKLKTLNETLAKVDEQSARLTRDSQEMENLNRTLIGINKVYDLHFASISRQVTTIEDINRQTTQLAAKIEEVNAIYTRMMMQLGVMVNPMGAAMTGAATTAAPAYGQPAYGQPAAPAQPAAPVQPEQPA